VRIQLIPIDGGRADATPAQRTLAGQARIVVDREEERCRLHATASMRLNGCPVEDAPLLQGDLLELDDGRRFRVSVEAAGTAPRIRVGLAAALTLLGGLLVAGLVVGDRPLASGARGDRDAQIDAQVAIARAREIERRRYEGRLDSVTHQIAELERRMAPRSTVDQQVGEVRQAVAQVERAMSARIGSEVARSLDANPDLRAAREALAKLEGEKRAIELLLAHCSDAVCVIQGAYGFGRPDPDGDGFEFLREAAPEQLAEWGDLGDKLPLVFEGEGPRFTIEFTGTGFLAGDDGIVLTNRHIAEPWWKSETAEPLLEQGFEPRFFYLRAFFPGRDAPYEFVGDRTLVADDADLAALRVRSTDGLPAPLELGVNEPPVIGARVVLLGYPSGLDALLARADENEDLVDSYLTPAGLDERGLMDALAARKLVRPLPSQGHVSDVLAERILFDAPTALGGSGGPLLDLEGRVVAINYGILKAFSRANFGVPAARAAALLGTARAMDRAPSIPPR